MKISWVAPEWDGGENDDGQQIVEVKYTDETVGDTTIQFKMLDEQVFKISAFHDPNTEIEKASDLAAELNSLYFMAYTTKHETELDSAEKMKAFIDELDQISGSAVLYGAAANYTGDRAQLCTLFGEDALETSVPWVLDAYGYLDMNDYAQQDTADTTAVEPASTADISSADYIFPSDRQYITEADMAGWKIKRRHCWLATRFMLDMVMCFRHRKSRITLLLNRGIRQIRPMMEAI